MATKKEKAKENELEEYLKNKLLLAGKIEDMVKGAEEARIINLPDWYELEQKWLGNWYMMYVKSADVLIPGRSPATGRTRRTINKLRSQLRGAKNLITRNDPTWMTEPLTSGEEAEKEAEISGHTLSYIYTHSGMKQVIGDLIWYGMMRSIGWLEADYDEERKLPIIRVWDPFDILLDPNAEDERDARFLIKVVPKSIADIMENENYETIINGQQIKLAPDRKVAYSAVKEKLSQYQINKSVPAISSLDTILLYEAHIKVPQDDGTHRIRIVTTAGKYVLRDEETDMTDFQFVSYKPERKPGSAYTTPWMISIISSNKALMRIVNQAEDYITKLQAGWILKRKGTKATKIYGQTGAIIEFEGVSPTVAPVPPMPRSFLDMIEYHERQIEDLGGMHSESLGRVKGGDRSGIALARLQAADVNNIAEPVTNLQITLERLAHRLLKQINDNWTSIREISYYEDGKYKSAKVVGSSASKTLKEKEGIQTIRDFDKIIVKIVPSSTFSDLAERTDARELFSAEVLTGNVGREAVLEAYKWGAWRNIAKRMREEGEDAEDAEVQKAEAENRAMAEGQQVQPQPEENHEMHILVHANYLKSQEVRANESLMAAVIAHIKAHEALQGQGSPLQAGTAVKPTGGAEPAGVPVGAREE